MKLKSNTIPIDDLIKHILKNKFEGIYSSLPARVESFNTETMRAVIQPLITHKDIHGNPQECTLFSEVPVLYPNSADVYLRTPLNKDDLVFVSYSSVAIDILLGVDKPADPGSVRKFSQKDGFVVGGYRYDEGSKTLSGFSEDVVLHRRSTDTIIRFSKDGDLIVSGAKKVQVECEQSEVTCQTSSITGQKHTIKGLVDITGNTTIKGIVDITGATKITGAATVVGALSATLGISGSGGEFSVEDGVMTAKGIKTKSGVDVDKHTHTGYQGAITSPPIPQKGGI